MNQPSCQSRDPCASNGSRTTTASGGHSGPHRQQRGERRRVGDELVRAQGVLGGLVDCREQSARLAGAEALPPLLDDPLRERVARRRAGRRAVVELGEQAVRFTRNPAQHRVDKALAARGARQCHRIVDGRVRGSAREGELVGAEPQRRADHGVELRQRAPRNALDQVVERRPSLYRAVGKPHRERALAPVEAGRGRVEGPVGECALLEGASQDREGDDARLRGHGRARRRRHPSPVRREA